MKLEQLHVEFKFASHDAATGEFKGLASTFGNRDRHGDVIAKGAFRRTLAEHKAAGTRPALLWAHDPSEPTGVIDDMAETEKGFEIAGRLADTQRAREARSLAKIDAISFSIGFVTKKFERKGETRTITDLDLWEVSFVALPANPAARITSVKAAGAAATEEGRMADHDDDTGPDTRALEKKADSLEADLKAANKRIEDLELKAARGAGAASDENTAELEKKALAAYARTGDDSELKSVSTSSDPDGGFLVLPTLERTVLQIVRDRTPMRELANIVTIGTDAYEQIIDLDEAGAVWVTEKGARPETSTPKLVKLRIPVGELYAGPRTTTRMLDDAFTDVGTWLTNAISDKFARTEATSFITGNGADDRPRGILDYPKDSKDDFKRKWGDLQFVANGHATDLSADALISLMMKLRTPYRANASWLMSRDTARIVRTLKDTNGRHLWAQEGGNIVEGVPERLLGFPVRYSEDMPAVAANEFPIAFGDFRQGYTIVDRHGIRQKRDELTQKPFVVFDAYKRVGGGVMDFNAIKFLKMAAN